MATTYKKTYRVTNLSQGMDDTFAVALVEHDENNVMSPGFVGAFTISIDAKDASKYLPGQLFEMTLVSK